MMLSPILGMISSTAAIRSENEFEKFGWLDHLCECKTEQAG